jgi:hypothetical protein
VPTRLPAIKQFSASLAKRKTDLNKNAETAGKFLVERREVIERFGNAEDLGAAAYGEQTPLRWWRCSLSSSQPETKLQASCSAPPR